METKATKAGGGCGTGLTAGGRWRSEKFWKRPGLPVSESALMDNVFHTIDLLGSEHTKMFEMNQEHDLNEKSGSRFHATSSLVCHDCSEAVCVGFGGEKNLAMHRTSKKNHDLRTFFKPCISLNPPTVVSPPLIYTDKRSFGELSDYQETTLETHKRHKEAMLGETQEAPEIGKPEAGETRNVPCQKGIELLRKLEAATTRILNDVPLATPAHRLSLFSADPHFCVANLEQGAEVEVESDWDILNPMLKTAFGLGELEMQEIVKEMLNRGEHGLDGFIRFFKFFVLQRGLEGAMIEPTIESLLHEIDSRYVPPSKPPSVPQSIAAGTADWEVTTAYPATACETVLNPALAAASGTVDSPIVLDHVSDLASKVVSDTCSDVADRAYDACANSAERKRKKISSAKGSLEGGRKARCEGIFVEFPHGKNHHTSYLFGLHGERNIPWDYRSTDDKFYIQAKICRKPLISKGSACKDCRALASHPSTSASWTEFDTGSTRMPHLSIMGSGVSSKSFGAKRDKCSSCD
ncbi:hypothetical protein EDB86DRAFT_1458433 [Lactarius hatsudake]|nr:hypothetical protein EDB86DRAFT_1458433 [Lactarius hatsudake]